MSMVKAKGRIAYTVDAERIEKDITISIRGQWSRSHVQLTEIGLGFYPQRYFSGQLVLCSGGVVSSAIDCILQRCHRVGPIRLRLLIRRHDPKLTAFDLISSFNSDRRCRKYYTSHQTIVFSTWR